MLGWGLIVDMHNWHRRIRIAAVAIAMLGGCTTPQKPHPAPMVIVASDPEWKSIATAEDAGRIARVEEAWHEALAQARKGGFANAIKSEGDLLQPDAALPRPAPTPGSYRCRVIKLGAQRAKDPAFNAYKPFFCYVEVEKDLLTIVKQTGTQRPAGRLYPDSEEKQLIFLGTLTLGSEDAPRAYGESADRNMAGIFERVAPFRFRLVIPWPLKESKLDVIELVPVPPAG
jgi:hypothetical protein